jgi:ribose 5-phosphate isomerase B
VQSGAVERGIGFCGTGMGVAIVANKFKGVYAGRIESEHAALKCKVINNCNVLAMGGMFVSVYKAKLDVDAWLDAEHAEGLDDELAGFLRRSLEEIRELEGSLYR